QGLLVSRLKRIRYGSIELPRGLRPGQHEALPEDVVKSLRELAGAGSEQPTLTLKPVLHQRNAARGVTEIRPASNTPHAWTGVRHDEARELTVFDRIRPDDFPSRGKRRRGPPRGDVNGNVLKPDKPANKKRRKGRGVAPGQELPSVRKIVEARTAAARTAAARIAAARIAAARIAAAPDGVPRIAAVRVVGTAAARGATAVATAATEAATAHPTVDHSTEEPRHACEHQGHHLAQPALFQITRHARTAAGARHRTRGG